MISAEINAAAAAVVGRLESRFAPQLAGTIIHRRLTQRAAEGLVEQYECGGVQKIEPQNVVPSTLPMYQLTAFTPEELRVIEGAFEYANLHKIPSVSAAVRDYVGVAASYAPSVHDCVAEYLVLKKTEGCRPATIKGYEGILREFSRSFGRSRPGEIELSALAIFLRRLPHPASVATRWRIVATFFRWLIRRKYAWENLVVLTMRSPGMPPTRGSAYSLAQVRWILAQTKFSDQIGFWALALYSGMRVAEIKRLGMHPAPWLLIRLTTGVIEVPRSIAKKRPRLVPILPVLRKWLQWIRKRNAPIFPVNGDDKISALRQRLAHHWPFDASVSTRKNVARRSYISYRLALPLASYTEVAAAAGNNEAIIRKFYRCPVSPGDAEVYFSFAPAKIPNLASSRSREA